MKLVLCVAFLLLAALPAKAVVLECDIVQRTSAWGWLAPRITIQYDEGSDEAIVMDAVIQEKRGKPVVAEIDSDTAARTTFVWTVAARSSDKQFRTVGDSSISNTFSKVRFRLTHFKGKGTANISAISGIFYRPEPASHGTCKFVG